MRRLTSLLLAVILIGCTGSDASDTTALATTTTTESTTTTTQPTTTTTLPPVVEIEGSERAALGRYITSFYAYATGRSDVAPTNVPTALIPEPNGHPDLGTVRGQVAVAEYQGRLIAVFKSENDILGLVRNDQGWRIVAGKAPSVGVRAWYGDDPIIIAVVGSDARPDEVATETRADSIHFLAMDGKGGAALVGVPRDSWVPIPGYGTSKINASLQAGGPEMMMETFTQLSGLDFDGYVITGFAGFEGMVDDVLLPFEFDVPFSFSDRAAKANFQAGPQEVDGTEALSFVRTRKAFTTGDFQRQLNGGTFLIGALIAAKLRGPLAFPEMIAGTEDHLSTDLSPGEMLRFALAANAVKVTEVSNVVLQGGTSTTSGGASIVVLSNSFAEETFADLADGRLDG
jgi:polyisoprenyl-teichoic acid--peptidoglycan teichoic acid transferase